MEKKLKAIDARAESAPISTSLMCVDDHWFVSTQNPINHKKVQIARQRIREHILIDYMIAWK